MRSFNGNMDLSDERVLNMKLDFVLDSVKSYRSFYNSKHEDSACAKLSDEEFLIKIGAAYDCGRSIRPTAAGLLMFGHENQIIKEYPDYYLEFIDHNIIDSDWTNGFCSKDTDWSGNVIDFYQKVTRTLLPLLKKPFKLVEGVRVDETPQHEGIREALCNCLANADYCQSGGVVIENYYLAYYVMSNPGSIVIGKEQMLKGGISRPRNECILKMLNLLGIGKHTGLGVPNIYKAWRDTNVDPPLYEEQHIQGKPNRTKLILPLVRTVELEDM